MEQSKTSYEILLEGTVPIGGRPRYTWIISFGGKSLTTTEVMEMAPSPDVLDTISMVEFMGFVELLNPRFLGEDPLVGLCFNKSARCDSPSVTLTKGQVKYIMASGYPYWQPSCRFLFTAPVLPSATT